MKRVHVSVSLMGVILIVLVSVLLSGCGGESGPDYLELVDDLPITERDFSIGVAGFTPAGMPEPSSEQWMDFFDVLPETGDLFGVYSLWDDDLDTQGIPSTVATACEMTGSNGMDLVVGLGFDLDLVGDADDYFFYRGDAFRSVAVSVAEVCQPDYLALGLEVDRLYSLDKRGFAEFVRVYRQAYDAVKAASPNTKVFTVFQLERMSGLDALSGESEGQMWDILDIFNGTIDVVGFTSYPFMEYTGMYDIPDDYYSSISDHTDLPIVFTEIGWPSASEYVRSDEEVQLHFLMEFVEQTNYLDMEFMLWSSLHDIPSADVELFRSVALRSSDGLEKEIWEYWLALESIGRSLDR